MSTGSFGRGLIVMYMGMGEVGCTALVGGGDETKLNGFLVKKICFYIDLQTLTIYALHVYKS